MYNKYQILFSLVSAFSQKARVIAWPTVYVCVCMRACVCVCVCARVCVCVCVRFIFIRYVDWSKYLIDWRFEFNRLIEICSTWKQLLRFRQVTLIYRLYNCLFIYVSIQYYVQNVFYLHYIIIKSGAKGDWDFRISDLVKNPDGTDILPCGEFRRSPEGPVSQIHSPRLLVGAPGIFSDLLRFFQMLKREWGAESNGKLPHLFIPSKTAI